MCVIVVAEIKRYLLECSGLHGPASLYNRMCIPVYDRQEKGMQRLQLETLRLLFC